MSEPEQQTRTHTCSQCGQSKSLASFLVNRLGHIKQYGNICTNCRAKAKPDDEDEGGGGRKSQHNVKASDAAVALKLQLADEADKLQDRKDAVEESDLEHQEKDESQKDDDKEKQKDRDESQNTTDSNETNKDNTQRNDLEAALSYGAMDMFARHSAQTHASLQNAAQTQQNTHEGNARQAQSTQQGNESKTTQQTESNKQTQQNTQATQTTEAKTQQQRDSIVNSSMFQDQSRSDVRAAKDAQFKAPAHAIGKQAAGMFHSDPAAGKAAETKAATQAENRAAEAAATIAKGIAGGK